MEAHPARVRKSWPMAGAVAFAWELAHFVHGRPVEGRREPAPLAEGAALPPEQSRRASVAVERRAAVPLVWVERARDTVTHG